MSLKVVFRAHQKSLTLAFVALVVTLVVPGLQRQAQGQTLPGYAHCEYVGPGGTIVCYPGKAVKGSFGGFGGTPVYDLCMVYFGDSPGVQGYCKQLETGRVGLPGAPQFPNPVGGTVFRPTGKPLVFQINEYCDWLFVQPGGIGHYEDVPTWVRNYCETRDPSQIPPGF